MVTKMLFEIPMLCFIFVLLESSNGDGATSEAFIFSLINSEGLAPFVSKVKQIQKAIQRGSYYGPTFGSDLVIQVEATRRVSSEASLGNDYPVPAPVRDKGSTILTGNDVYFSPDEVEVFYLDPSS